MAGSEFQSLEVKGIKALVRFLFNLTARGVLSVRNYFDQLPSPYQYISRHIILANANLFCLFYLLA